MAHNDYLMHYGVRGMKWGVRKTPEQLGYRPSGQRSASGKALLGKSTKVARRFAKTSSSKIKQKISDPEFQRKVATGAKVALAIGAVYATHKIANSPQTIQLGKDILSGVLGKTGNMKASMLNSAEFKAAKAGLGLAKKGASAIGSENFRNTVTGIGALAGTVGILKNQLKGLREDKVDGDAVDKAVTYTKKISEIGESLNTIAQGPKGASSNSDKSSNNSSNPKSAKSAFSEQKGKEISEKVGKPSNKGIDKNSKEHQSLFKGQSESNRTFIKKMAANGYDIDQIRKYLDEFDSQFDHSAIRIGWSFNPMAGCRYIF